MTDTHIPGACPKMIADALFAFSSIDQKIMFEITVLKRTINKYLICYEKKVDLKLKIGVEIIKGYLSVK